MFYFVLLLTMLNLTVTKSDKPVLELFPEFRQIGIDVRQHKKEADKEYQELLNIYNQLQRDLRNLQYNFRRRQEWLTKYRRSCKITEKGAEYRGNIAKTRSGWTCQRWDRQWPHKHSQDLPGPDSGHANYCRNPDGSDKPWCYTTSRNKKWEYCNIPWCWGDPILG